MVGEELAGHQGFLEEIERLHPAFIELEQFGPVLLFKSSLKGAATLAKFRTNRWYILQMQMKESSSV